MYLAGVSVRRVEDITEALWGTRVSSGTVSRLNQKFYRHIEAWRNLEIVGDFPYVYLDGVILKRGWSGEVKNVSVLVAIGVGADGFRQILGVAEGEKEDLEGWRGFLRHLKDRGLKGVRLIISDACRGLIEAAAEVFPKTDWQRCTAIHAQEDRAAAQAKAKEVAARLKAMKLQRAADLVEQKAIETLTYYSYPRTHMPVSPRWLGKIR
jgi:transposase-like protein